MASITEIEGLHFRIAAHLHGLSQLVGNLEETLADILDVHPASDAGPLQELQQLDFLRQSLADVGKLTEAIGGHLDGVADQTKFSPKVVLDSTKALVAGSAEPAICASGDLDLL